MLFAAFLFSLLEWWPHCCFGENQGEVATYNSIFVKTFLSLNRTATAYLTTKGRFPYR